MWADGRHSLRYNCQGGLSADLKLYLLTDPQRVEPIDHPFSPGSPVQIISVLRFVFISSNFLF